MNAIGRTTLTRTQAPTTSVSARLAAGIARSRSQRGEVVIQTRALSIV